jgi:hypothetical protein
MPASYTPGPWSIYKYNDHHWFIEGSDEHDDEGTVFRRSIVCLRPLDDVYPDDVEFDDRREKFVPNRHLNERDKANARLIASAPDMLEALKAMLQWMPVYPAAADAIVGGRQAHQAAIDASRAAIAKATGA